MTPDELRAARTHLSLTQEALAHRLGVARATVQNWERGTHRVPPTAERLIKSWASWKRVQP